LTISSRIAKVLLLGFITNMLRRKTRQRMAIMEVLKGVRTHPSAEWIYSEVRKKISNISKGTVYRNLMVLEEEGAIIELNLDGTVKRYEVRQNNHYHFICNQCGRIYDLSEPVDTELNVKFAKKTGFRITHHQLEFRGFCKDCQGSGRR
jgi:Fur family transcriptional regulator, peroxide stress response regulator